MIRHFCDWCGRDVGGASSLREVQWKLQQGDVEVTSNRFAVCRDCLGAADIRWDGKFRIEGQLAAWLDRLIKTWKHKAVKPSASDAPE